MLIKKFYASVILLILFSSSAWAAEKAVLETFSDYSKDCVYQEFLTDSKYTKAEIAEYNGQNALKVTNTINGVKKIHAFFPAEYDCTNAEQLEFFLDISAWSKAYQNGTASDVHFYLSLIDSQNSEYSISLSGQGRNIGIVTNSGVEYESAVQNNYINFSSNNRLLLTTFKGRLAIPLGYFTKNGEPSSGKPKNIKGIKLATYSLYNSVGQCFFVDDFAFTGSNLPAVSKRPPAVPVTTEAITPPSTAAETTTKAPEKTTAAKKTEKQTEATKKKAEPDKTKQTTTKFVSSGKGVPSYEENTSIQITQGSGVHGETVNRVVDSPVQLPVEINLKENEHNILTYVLSALLILSFVSILYLYKTFKVNGAKKTQENAAEEKPEENKN